MRHVGSLNSECRELVHNKVIQVLAFFRELVEGSSSASRLLWLARVCAASASSPTSPTPSSSSVHRSHSWSKGCRSSNTPFEQSPKVPLFLAWRHDSSCESSSHICSSPHLVQVPLKMTRRHMMLRFEQGGWRGNDDRAKRRLLSRGICPSIVCAREYPRLLQPGRSKQAAKMPLH